MAYRSSKPKNINPLGDTCRKKMYNSREEAEDMIRYIEETRVSKQIHAYRCNVCGFWHLTSRNEG